MTIPRLVEFLCQALDEDMDPMAILPNGKQDAIMVRPVDTNDVSGGPWVTSADVCFYLSNISTHMETNSTMTLRISHGNQEFYKKAKKSSQNPSSCRL